MWEGNTNHGAKLGLLFCVSLLGWIHLVASVVSFLFFTDMLIYWIHRGLHHRLVYKVESFRGQRRGKIAHISVL